MEWWQIVLLTLVGMALTVLVSAFIVWRMASGRTKKLSGRIGALPWRSKLTLAGTLMRDERVPLTARILLPLLVLYLALPIDLIPDFIPVIGQIDDIVVIVVGLALLIRLVPTKVLDQHISDLEPAIELGPGYPQLPEPNTRETG